MTNVYYIAFPLVLEYIHGFMRPSALRNLQKKNFIFDTGKNSNHKFML